MSPKLSSEEQLIRNLQADLVIPKLFPNAVKEGENWCMGSVHGEKGKSLRIWANLRFQDFNTGDKGWLPDLWRAFKGLANRHTAVVDLVAKLDLEPAGERSPATSAPTPVPHDAPEFPYRLGQALDRKANFALKNIYEYRSIKGELLYYVLRFEGPPQSDGGKRDKEIRPVTFDLDTWQWTMRGPKWAKRPLYRLQELAAHPDRDVLIVEGEKAADAAAKLFDDFVVVSWAGGAKAVRHVDASPLKNRAVVIWRDNDDAGRQAEAELISLLAVCGVSSVRTVDPSSTLVHGWDLADAVPSHVNLRSLIGEAKSIDLFDAGKFHDLPYEAFLHRLIYVGEIEMFVDGESLIHFGIPGFNKLVQHQHFSSQDLLKDPALRKVERMAYKPLGEYPIVKLGHSISGLNTWLPTKVQPRPGNAFPFLRLLRRLCNDKDEAIFLVRWLAHLIQRPHIKMKFAVILVGKQGTGKSTLAQIAGKLIGEKNFGIIGPGDIRDNFNEYMDSRILNIAEEIFDFSGRFEMSNKLKEMITGTKVTINKKHLRPYVLDNFVHFLFLTNHLNALKITPDDRRYFVVYSDRDKASDRYFSAFNKWLVEGESVILHFLQNVDLKEFNPNKAPPRTTGREIMEELTEEPLEAALKDMIASNRPPFQHDVFELNQLLTELRKQDDLSWMKLSRPSLLRVLRVLGAKKIRQVGGKIHGKNVRYTLWASRNVEAYKLMSDQKLLDIYSTRGKDDVEIQEIPF